jgi:hypothetical protein
MMIGILVCSLIRENQALYDLLPASFCEVELSSLTQMDDRRICALTNVPFTVIPVEAAPEKNAKKATPINLSFASSKSNGSLP